jgi:hemolysin activation/secretion protein
MLKTTICTIALVVVSHSAFAAGPPSAGGQFQQIPPTPIQKNDVPKIRIEQETVPVRTDADTVRITVTSLNVTGQTLYSGAELLAITGFIPGSRLTLSELRGMASRIADHYHRNGYFVAQAYLPAQDILEGVVTISVFEGHYGKILLNNRTNISDSVAYNLIGGLNSGDLIASAPLERRLLLLSDLPGVEVKSTLIPGSSPGTSDLIIDITPGQRLNGSVDADNAGNRYTGEYRIGATLNLNEPLGVGDVASLRVLTSGFGLYYVRGSYQMQLAKARVGVAYSTLGYELGEEFKSLRANGTAQIVSLYGSYPLIRSRSTNLFAGLAIDAKQFNDRVDSTSTVTDKRALVVMGSLYGDHRDTFFGGGLSDCSLTWSAGSLNIQTEAAYTVDQNTAHSNGRFDKIGYRASRLQRVTDAISLYAAINGQFAFKNLDVSEKMELGGMYAVRAYPEGEAYADQGFVVNVEARLLLPALYKELPGQMHAVGFIDFGSVVVNKNNWTSEANSRTLSGAGPGFTWMDRNNFSLKTYYALKLGNEKATSAPDYSSGRFWIQFVKYF